ncbi:MAG: DJ-1/PfpI family protein [Bacteriovoracia bacterium]
MLVALMVLKGLMTHGEPEALPLPPPHANLKPSRPLAVIVVSNLGTQITELAASYEIIAASGAFQVVTAAPTRKLSATTTELAILPEAELDEIPRVDLLVLPSVLDPTEEKLVAWVKEFAPKAKWILAHGEGARLLAAAGQLTNRRATSHFVALEDLRTKYPEVAWIDDESTVIDGNLITSAGIYEAIDAAFLTVEIAAGDGPAAQARQALGFDKPSARSRGKPAATVRAGWRSRDALTLFLTAGYDWTRRGVGILLYPGVSALAAAAVGETFPRTTGARVVSVGEKRELVPTAFGLEFAPTIGADALPALDMLVVPAGPAGAGQISGRMNPLGTETVKKMVPLQNVRTKDLTGGFPAQAFTESLNLLARVEGDRPAELVTRLIGYNGPAIVPGRPWPDTWLWLRPLILAVFGVWMVYLLSRRRTPS